MQSLKARILRIIATILGFFGISSTFVACYGVPINAIGGRIFLMKTITPVMMRVKK